MLDHTADLAVALEASSLEGLFECAIHALRSLVFGPAVEGAPTGELELAEDAADLEDALVLFCNDLIYEMTVRRHVPWGLASFLWTGSRFEARVLVGPKTETTEYERELKAATYGGAQVTERDGHWSARLVFDV